MSKQCEDFDYVDNHDYLKSIEKFNEIKSYDQLDYLMQGVKSLKDDSTPDEPVAQSLFFFPLIGLMYDLASAINES